MPSMTASGELPLPLVDFADFPHGDATTKQRIGDELIAAMASIGFVYVRGLEEYVSEKQLESMFEWNRRFFDLPEEVKALAPHPANGAHHRGYSAIGREKVIQDVVDAETTAKARTTASDVKESFEFGNKDDKDQPNILLPEDKLPGFNDACESFYWACNEAAKALLSAFAIGLNLPSDFFLPYHSQSDNQLRLLHYPPVSKTALERGEAARISAHTDFDTFTILFQDAAGGLEVEDPKQKGVYIPAVPVPGAAVINTGDFLQRWSNDRLTSTMHRVRAPPEDNVGNDLTTERYSIPYFVAADLDRPVSTLRTCITPEQPDRYPEPIAFREYVMERLAKNY